MLKLTERTKKPRSIGLTCLNDTGLTIAQTASLLNDYGDLIDVVKFGIGSAYLTKLLKKKVEIYRDAGIVTYCGGTLFEKFYSQGKLEEYFDYLRSVNIDHMEISSGTIDISLDKSLEILRQCREYFVCFCEVGTKDQYAMMTTSKWVEWIRALMDGGAEYVIAEGRDSGSAGIFRPSGEIRGDLITELVAEVGYERMIFEAPNHSSQMYLINTVGPNVNLGNINPADVLVLETQRNGLRYETFFL